MGEDRWDKILAGRKKKENKTAQKSKLSIDSEKKCKIEWILQRKQK